MAWPELAFVGDLGRVARPVQRPALAPDLGCEPASRSRSQEPARLVGSALAAACLWHHWHRQITRKRRATVQAKADDDLEEDKDWDDIDMDDDMGFDDEDDEQPVLSDWDDEDNGVGFRFEEDDEGDLEGEWIEGDDEDYRMSGDVLVGDEGAMEEEDEFSGTVFEGMDEPAGSSTKTQIPSYEELSLLYDDFPVQQSTKPKEPKERPVKLKEPPQGKRLEYLEEREYEVCAEGIAVRTLPDERSPRTGEILRQGDRFTAVEAVDGIEDDRRLYLRLPNGRGWVFNDESIYPGFPSVKLVAQIKAEKKEPQVIKRPLVAVIGRPNVGKSTLVNRMCDIADVVGGIAHDEVSVTHDRTYKQATHTDDCGDTFLFDVIDTGGLVFEDNLATVTFAREIRFQTDVALREAAAAVMVVDATVGLTKDDFELAKYVKETYVSRGLRVVLAVAKADRLETMDLKAADFWELGLGEPLPLSAYHRRGVWEMMDALVNRGCDGLFPKKLKGVDQIDEPRDNAIKVAICGKPNAGKSSLFNALVGEDRSIVSDIPGATTDSVDAYLEAYNGKTYRFVDTAGIKKRGKIRSETMWLSIHRAMKAIKRSDVAVLCLDASEIMTGSRQLGNAFWCPDIQMRYIARAIEERGVAAVIVLTKWDAVPSKDEKSQQRFIQAIRSNLAGVGQWAEVVTCSAKTGQRVSKVIDAIDKTLASHRKHIPTTTLNEVIRDALLWKLPPAKAYKSKQGRIYYATQVSTQPPKLVMFCNNPRLFGPNYKIYLENKIRQDLGWFGTPFEVEYRKRTEKRAVSQAEQWLGPRLQPSEAWR
ncbi:unnamed protein product [Effrenium voratum]|uniref:GTPase Der n=1 Tax=Effrenium voratum TaxID=2562239 RepID=A0AA36ITQ2_9DINO|nr:unnamed protein product [Effrenium voratum]